jgi:acetyltransferase-like isoleucine patch superfamily enzyme
MAHPATLIPAFRKDAASALRFFRAAIRQREPQRADGMLIGVFVCPWLQTAVPWFNLALALLLRRAGHQVAILWDDLSFEDSPVEYEQQAIIGRVLRHLGRGIEVLRISAQTPLDADADEQARIGSLAFSNLIRGRMTSVGAEAEQAALDKLHRHLAENFAHIKSVGGVRRWNLLVAPGGIYANSGLYLLAGRNRGVRVATYDAGYGRLFVGTDDVACYFYDDLRAFHEVVAAHPAGSPQIERIQAAAMAEFQARLAGTDALKFQPVPDGQSITTPEFDVVIPMSIDWDAPGLGRNRFFPSPALWVRETIEYLLEHTSARIAFRQHPYIRHVDWWHGKDGYRELLADLLDRYPQRLHFYGAEDKINTYELIRHSKVVLPYVSAIGIEAVFLGKPVIVESCAHYSRLPFVHAPTNRADYFRLIEAGITGRLPAPDARAVAQAGLYFHIFQSAHYLFTEFTPQPQDFARWVAKPLAVLATDPNIRILMHCLTENTPIALMHLANELAATPQGTTSMDISTSPTTPPAATADLTTRFPDVSFGAHIQIIGLANTRIGAGSCIGDGSWINVCNRDTAVRLSIGRCVLVGRHSMLSSGDCLEIGDYCLFAPRVYVSSADHVFADIAQPIIQQGATLNRTLIIEENCWLGINAVVSGHLTVGRGSVVAANTVVNRDIPPFSVVAGNPARIVKMYDPKEGQWVRTRSNADIRRVMTHRQLAGLPAREEYAAMLARNARLDRIDPLVAGRGVSI